MPKPTITWATRAKSWVRFEEAAASYTQALVLEPDSADSLHGNLGMALQELGRLDEAEASFRQAIVLKTDICCCLQQLGYLAAKSG